MADLKIKDDSLEIEKLKEETVEALDNKLESTEALKNELTEFEQEQVTKGWDPAGEKSAEEWARAAPLYQELKEGGREIKQLRRTVDELKVFMEKSNKLAYEKALTDLSTQRDRAIKSGNVDLVNKIDEEARTYSPSIPVSDHPAVADFKEKYSDILNGTSYEALEMSKFITKRDQELFNKGMPPDQHMKVLEEHLHKQFPDQFSNKRSANSVDRGYDDNVSSKNLRRKVTFNDLDSTQKKIARDFEKLGVLKIEDYIKQLVEAGEVK